MIKDIFSPSVSEEVINRIRLVKKDNPPLWGKMNAAQMFAHCNVAYNYTYHPENFKKPGTIKRFFLRTFLKKIVAGPKPYSKNSPTGPDFLIADTRDFEREKNILIENIQRTCELGRSHFEGKSNFSFGKMTSEEWNTLFYKHIDHHLSQFGV
jgi:hypothetical protein